MPVAQLTISLACVMFFWSPHVLQRPILWCSMVAFLHTLPIFVGLLGRVVSWCHMFYRYMLRYLAYVKIACHHPPGTSGSELLPWG